MPKMAGPWIPLPEEIVFLLEKEAATCTLAYILMLVCFPVEEITDTEGIWVAGRIHVTRYRIAQRVDKSVGHFNSRIWPRWIAIGLVEIKDGGIYLPFLYKKGDSILQPAKIAQEIKELKTWQMKMAVKSAEMAVKSAEMEKTIQNLLTALAEPPEPDEITDKGRKVISAFPASMRPETGSPEAGSGLIEAGLRGVTSLYSFKDRKISLSDANKLISAFYRAIGQNRISRPVRDKANATIRKLQIAGYLSGEIAYALHWIPENAKEPVEHFGIVPHMIEQAVAAGRKILAKEEADKALEEAEAKSQESRMSEQDERELLKKYKEGLPPEERDQLLKDALENLKNTPGIKSDYIVEPLVEAMENDIIRKSGVDLQQEATESGDNVSE